ncbi:MAG: DMT family transporter [Promethearchaeota archaeon]
MENGNLKKGLLFGTLAIFTIALQPVIANARPKIIDPYLFAAITSIIEALIFLPVYILERGKLKNSTKVGMDEKQLLLNKSLLNGWKKPRNIKLLLIIGFTFSIVPILNYIGFELAGAINSSLIFKSEIIFALIFGYLLLNEKITVTQILFCCLLFFGLIISVTQASFNLLEINTGVILLLISVTIFTLVHTLTKSGFDRNELFPTQVVFLRNSMSGMILFFTYILFLPLDNLLIVIDPNNFVFFLLMGVDYGVSLFLWYKSLTYIEIGKASVVLSLTPIVSAFFSFIILGEVFTLFHLIGTIIIIISIIFIVKQKK